MEPSTTRSTPLSFDFNSTVPDGNGFFGFIGDPASIQFDMHRLFVDRLEVPWPQGAADGNRAAYGFCHCPLRVGCERRRNSHAEGPIGSFVTFVFFVVHFLSPVNVL